MAIVLRQIAHASGSWDQHAIQSLCKQYSAWVVLVCWAVNNHNGFHYDCRKPRGYDTNGHRLYGGYNY